MRISFVFGTRPEAIKLAPVIKEFARNNLFELNICFTGQHKDMVIPILKLFNINIHVNLETMSKDQQLSEVVGVMFTEIGKYLSKIKPDVVFVQGDTTTAMVAATVAFFAGIKVAHVEAGLRTNDIYSPFPEEFNRVVISKITNFHFAATKNAFNNLLNEGVSSEHICLTGNTGIDALVFASKNKSHNLLKFLPEHVLDKKIVLITCHRRENFGLKFKNICKAVKELSEKFPDVNFIYPVHLNPNVNSPARKLLSDIDNVILIEPIDYFDFVQLMNKSYLIITDSGGIQEEAPSLNKPLLIIRENTERQEGVTAGTAILAGTSTRKIVERTTTLLENKDLYLKMTKIKNPFGDGMASKRIHEYLESKLK
ncbi:non-hydrolyzing UDP-N-acetylglucosamine 2-epimerase [Pedobacter paludis]|uniref:UDP-N-acetylglucosamine 2-epimerase (non-hydrolyzing) n=1 Tax=Pedobacter paludis TaxID=2203212 RepID=A0A317EXX0_9SPHI|nr:UDP-N-acetylglucosamine 2-epimerase (non-hydrolyzing) [Pedobacter paludis]PWS31681.1 UDP-N-acetylglucosamine 2-epimerase (non-hydrolyzing) [Pedobacter paludis]